MSALDLYYERKKKKKPSEGLEKYKNNTDNATDNSAEGQTALERYKSRKSTTEKYDADKWFKKGAFSDGYQFGDVLKTAGSTLGDVAVGMVQGIGNTMEGLVDLGAYGIANSGLLSESDSEWMKIVAQEKQLSFLDKADDFVSKKSLLGDRADMITEGLGNVGLIIATGGIAAGAAGANIASTIATTGLTGLSSWGSGMTEAYQGGATDKEAAIYGFSKGTIDAGTELIFGGLGKGVKALGVSKGIGGLDDMFAKSASSKLAGWITNPTVRTWIGNSIEGTIKAGGEGAEEVLAGLGTSFAKKLTYLSDEDLSQLVKDENLLDNFIVGFLVGEIAQGKSVVDASKQGQDFVTGLTENESKVADKVYESKIAEEEQNGKKLTNKEKNKIYDAVLEQMDRGEIDIDTIEEVLGGETYSAYKSAIDNENALQTEFDTLNKMKQGEMTGEQIDRRAELKQQFEESKNNSNTAEMKTKLGDEVFSLVKDSKLAESYNQKALRGKVYEVDLSQVEEKYQGTYKKAVESGVLNNTRKTHDFVDMLAKLSADKGVSFDFTNNENLKNSGFSIDGKIVNGYVAADGSITLNTQSQKYLNSVVGHEVTHILEGTELYDALKTAVTEYAKTKGEYDTRLADITDIYKNIENADPEAELIADLIGDYVFTDEAFVRSLSTQNRSLFQKIFDEIKYLCKIVTSGSKDARQLEKVKKVFSDVYRDSGTTQQKNTTENSGGVRYSIASDERGDYVKVDVHQDVFDGKNTREMQEIARKLIKDNFKVQVLSVGKDGKAYVNKRSSDEYAYPANRRMSDDIKEAKMRSAPELDNLLAVSEFVENQTDDGRHPQATGGWDIYTTRFEVADTMFNGEVKIMVTDRGYVFYDITQIERLPVNGGQTETNSVAASGNLSIKSIPNSTENVNTEKNNSVRYSLSDIEIPTREQLESKGAVKIIDISIAKTKGTYAERRSQIKREMQNIISVPYLNKDTQTMIFLTTKSYEHAFSNSGGIQLNAAEHLPELIENAVLTHAEENTHGSEYATGVYTFFAAVKADKIRPVKLKVKEFSYRGQELPKNIKEYFNKNLQDYAASYDTVVLEVEEIEESSIGSVKDIDENNLFLDPNELSEISIADLLNLVNGSAKKYVPDRVVTSTKNNDNSNDIAPVQNSLSNDGEQVGTKYGDYAVSGEDIRLESRDDIAPLPEKTESDTEYPDDYAPIGEGIAEDDAETKENDAEIDGIIKTLKDGLSQKQQNYETERKNLTEMQQETLSNIDAKIAETQAKYDGKKNKDTRIANTLLRRIESLKTRKANIEADYAKRLNNLDSRIQRIDDLSQKDYTQVAEIEKAINRIDKIFEIDKATLDEEFDAKRAEYANKNVFIGREAKKLYDELTNLKKGTRASKQLGYLLDLGYDFKSLKSALAHIDMSPAKLVNVNSDIEANVRLALDAEYDEKIAALDGEYRERLTQLESDAENKRKAARTANQRKTKMSELEAQVAELIGDTSTWVDKKFGLSYKVNTLRRNLRDIVRDEYGNRDIKKADAIYDYLQGTYNKNEAELNRESNRIKEQFEKEKINDAESEYIMLLGELRENPETTLTEKEVGDFLEKHRNKIDTEKVDRVIEQWRKTADDLFERVNKVLKDAGMKEIPYRKGYYFHFTEEQGKVAKFFEKALNWKTRNNEIPTDIAGLTEQFNPQRKWQSFDKQRKGDSTVYDFLRSADQYINGTLDWIYHIEDIQKRRAFENHIRYVHSEEGIKSKIDALRNSDIYDADELQKEIELVLNEAGNPLNNFVSDFRTSTNTLAGKKSSMDRGMEELTNRKFYSTMTNLSNRVSANMVGGSISSALTNFIPITQSWGQVSPIKSLKAIGDTVCSYFKDDGVVNKSDFLTNRLKSADSLYKTTWDKIGDKVGLLMESIDNFTSQTVWRSKYNDNISKGMSENVAIKDADQFAENVMAGRSRGNMPTIFDSKNPIIKTMTMFQLEVNNQYGYMFKDMPQDVKNNATKNLIKGYASMFVGAYAYNALFSALTGRDAAFDPIGIIEDLLRDMGLFGDDDEEEPAETLLNFTDNILEEVPFISGLVGGGRVPISSALPYGEGVYETFEGTVNDIAAGDWNSLTEEWLNPVTYLLPPVGGGQIKKTVQGLSMFNTDEDHPIAGSYTADGSLRYPVNDTFGNRIQAALFGRWANKNAQDYIEDGRKPLQEKQQQELVDSGMSIQDYWEYREGLSGLKTLNEKADYIADLDLPTDTKNLLLNNIADRDEKIDLEGYENFADFEEFDFANKNPEKYEFLQSQGVTVSEYQSFDDDTKAAYSWATQYPEKYQVSRAVSDDVVEYKSYSKALSGIVSDKDQNGKSISGSRKKKVVDYINELDLDYGQKIILLKSEYASDDRYNREIVEYLNDRDDISRSEMETILQELGLTVLSDGTVKW